MLYIDQVLYPVQTLGPGRRVGIWVVGCNRRCPGCSNPELWTTQKRTPISVEALLDSLVPICRANRVDGFTITGGEPMLQAAELLLLLQQLRKIHTDILLFTGNRYEELLKDKDTRAVLNEIAVLVDGEYVQEKNEGLPLRGSSNQRIFLLDLQYRERYEAFLDASENSGIQNFFFEDGVKSVGIQKRDFQNDLAAILPSFGLRREDNGEDGEME